MKSSFSRVSRALRNLSVLSGFIGTLIFASSAFAIDSDKDEIDDAIDNCTSVANPDQRDTDGDGIGNVCDGDLNNDGVVNTVDIAFMKKVFLTDDANADLNGDGTVNELDMQLLQRMLRKPPGPSQTAINPATVNNPPPASDAQLFTLDTPLADGRNAAVLVKYISRRGGSVVLAPEGKAVVLNDIGVSPDLEANDGTFSGFLTLDVAASARSLESFRKRLARLPKSPPVGSFAGRQLVRFSDFNPVPILPKPIPLPNGINLLPFPHFPFPLPATVDPSRALAITDLSVVADPTRTFDPCDSDHDGNFGNPNGPWTFKTLMTKMANTPVTGISAQGFVHAWLKSWLTNDGPNPRLNFTIPNRAFGMQNEILNHISGWDENNPATLNLDTLPFRLLAIVNRIDLAKALTYGPGSPGELRFVFGLLRNADNPALCQPHPAGMSVIFEYGVPNTTCSGLKNLAQSWINLDVTRPAFPSPIYNAALQTFTDPVTAANAVPTKPNGSAINQLRTNDVALNFPWELREFRLREGAVSSLLEHRNLKQTPDAFKNFTADLRNYINDNASQIDAGTHVVPRFFPPRPDGIGVDDEIFPAYPPAPAGASAFLGSSLGYGPGFSFDTGGILGGVAASASSRRHAFSLNTCGGCHAAEALDQSVTLPSPPFGPGTPESFYHVDARTPAGLPARLSRFMTGTLTTAPFTPIPDPAVITVPEAPHHFNDLQRRAQVMEDLATNTCFLFPRIPVLTAVH